MNKQELLDKIDAYSSSEGIAQMVLPSDAYTVMRIAYRQCKKWVQQLDEPEKVIVPQFVADWFEAYKHDLSFSIYETTAQLFEEYNCEEYSEEFLEWFQVSENKPIETLIRMLDGYEVEKEPVYYVKHKNDDTYFVEFINSSFSSIWDDEINRIKSFKDKTKADAVAVLVSGEVVEG